MAVLKQGSAGTVLLTATVFCLFTITPVQGDYLFSFRLSMFDITNNRLANGSCCVPPEEAGTCTTQCTIKLLYCFRPFNYPTASNDCPLLAVVSNTTNAGRTLLFPGAWMGGLQLLIRVEHIGDDILDDNQLIDRVIIELFLSVDDSPSTFSGTGERGTVSALVSQVSVTCEGTFFGTDCNTFCIMRDDSTGHFRCDEDGNIVCLSGYQNPDTNCTECVPAPNCSPVGGFCIQPGECRCREGFSGNQCNEEEGEASIFTAPSATVRVSSRIPPEVPITTTTSIISTSTTSTSSLPATADTTRATSEAVKPTTSRSTETDSQSSASDPSPASHSPTSPPSVGDDGGQSHGIGLIVGIVLGVLCCLLLCVGLVAIVTIWRKRRGRYTGPMGSKGAKVWDIREQETSFLAPVGSENLKQKQSHDIRKIASKEDIVVANPHAQGDIVYTSILLDSPAEPSTPPHQSASPPQPLTYAILDHGTMKHGRTSTLSGTPNPLRRDN